MMKYYFVFNSGIGLGAIMSMVLGAPETTSEIVIVWLAFLISPLLAYITRKN